ncbi:hypothetical protein QCM80_46250 [Bradyrhizobium sp. SSUT112]|uniref:hypothetical protein n=1 Tax=Bradyrhizobium sp. SSUT112 TaxID=3040604 RepID=UPI00244CD85B|nr:hypothetical protein [Bradyrhizobium sp. SSUT112]MDH2357836.1 hypothetical protein [Bradyrhizobium sp. SSUT112]
MTSKSVELAIFWLPMIAGVLLGGLAGSAWYGGDKIPAIWIGFFGTLCFLLTGALQLQQFVYANVLQPEIELILPDQRSLLSWDPPKQFGLRTEPASGPAPPANETKSPVVSFQNKSNVGAQDATATWEISRIDNKALMSSSSRLSKWELQFDGDHVTIGPKAPMTEPTGLPHMFAPAFRQAVPLPFLPSQKETESFIPYNVWTEAMLIVLGTLPDQPELLPV